MGLFDRLIDDAAMLPPADVAAGDAVNAHQECREAWFAGLIGPLVVPDQRLAEVGRAVGESVEPVQVSVVNTGGAGGLLALGRRMVAGVEVVAVESALRDLDDLVGNVARVAAAAGELDDLPVFVEIPYGLGWIDAVEEVEAAGLLGKLSIGGPELEQRPSAGLLAEQLSALVEADLPFKIAFGSAPAWPHTDRPAQGGPPRHGLLTIMLALEALIDGAATADAAEVLRLDQPDKIREAIDGWDEAVGMRVRRRLRCFSCARVQEVIGELESLGLAREQ